jgi:hypothetical protein
VSEVKLLAQEKRQVATLEEVARRAVHNGTPTEQAVAELRRISPNPLLLGVAAGRARGRWMTIPLFHSIGQEVAELLLTAGADPDVFAMTASSVERRLRRHVRRG